VKSPGCNLLLSIPFPCPPVSFFLCPAGGRKGRGEKEKEGEGREDKRENWIKREVDEL